MEQCEGTSAVRSRKKKKRKGKRKGNEGSRTGQLHTASATKAEIIEEEEPVLSLDQGVSSLTWKSLLEGGCHGSNMVNKLFKII